MGLQQRLTRLTVAQLSAAGDRLDSRAKWGSVCLSMVNSPCHLSFGITDRPGSPTGDEAVTLTAALRALRASMGL